MSSSHIPPWSYLPLNTPPTAYTIHYRSVSCCVYPTSGGHPRPVHPLIFLMGAILAPQTRKLATASVNTGAMHHLFIDSEGPAMALTWGMPTDSRYGACECRSKLVKSNTLQVFKVTNFVSVTLIRQWMPFWPPLSSAGGQCYHKNRGQ
jgi:hypothetical protein